MGFNIAVAGKGGTGKTTVTGLMLRHLVGLNRGRVLAVDADANMNLNEVLGLGVHQTIGQIREGLGTVPQGMTKDAYINYRTQECLIEGEGFDLIAMGRPEGAGCYCYANTLCKKYVDEMADNYRYVVLDNEAGMEHLSRRTTHNMDVMFAVTDSSVRGIQAAGRIRDLVAELKLSIGKMALIINRVPDGELQDATKTEIERLGLELAGVVPNDPNIYQFDLEGKATFLLPEDSPAVKTVAEILEQYLDGEESAA
ncbi:MAG: carbon monoxide dehydrogenase [Deltaproteobacteria bacterium]|nr:MAG: carbon monoxide dehydrogenase [Deltaproteobacteria bacterium]